MTDIRSECSTFRTRNAGAFLVSSDMVFTTEEAYLRWRDSGVITAEAVAALLHVDPATVQIIDYPAANAIKVTMPRRTVAGGPDDTDLDSAAQFVPLLALRLP
ncbi:DUF4387 family protein [Dactylosporangium sp. NPDC005555]|uniref:DUF4387 family protein n=1 Tax=Dactylosporangium sp. NPDC005555 TaxID=3154889 RepID=UPI0033A616AB